MGGSDGSSSRASESDASGDASESDSDASELSDAGICIRGFLAVLAGLGGGEAAGEEAGCRSGGERIRLLEDRGGLGVKSSEMGGC